MLIMFELICKVKTQEALTLNGVKIHLVPTQKYKLEL